MGRVDVHRGADEVLNCIGANNPAMDEPTALHMLLSGMDAGTFSKASALLDILR